MGRSNPLYVTKCPVPYYEVFHNIDERGDAHSSRPLIQVVSDPCLSGKKRKITTLLPLLDIDIPISSLPPKQKYSNDEGAFC
ncbi:unnamed protein product [Danaus chrysippus]|uniref:(African queen) hypothetical protein n=1 Tax=Danaus chrysippus TaxID=151541 RepID=A0A8J2RAP1_9NEOP|nr:unnamed protein product [Danaus chrysippus]